MRKVFISYADADKEFVERLFIDLRSSGLEVQFDRALALEESWVKTLEVAIRESDFVLAIISPKYFESPWAEKEMLYSISREEYEGVIRTVPVLAVQCELPFALEGRIKFDLSVNYREGVNRLVSWIMSGIAAGVRQRSAKPGDLRPIRLKKDLKSARDFFTMNQSEKRRRVFSGGRGCFVLMPFENSDLDVVYEDFIKPVMQESGFDVMRADDIFGSQVIMEDVFSSIRSARLLIAELTGRNANVFYEVGIAHALRKDVLLLSQSIDDVPFDLRHRRVLLYEYTPRGCKLLQETLKHNLPKPPENRLPRAKSFL